MSSKSAWNYSKYIFIWMEKFPQNYQINYGWKENLPYLYISHPQNWIDLFQLIWMQNVLEPIRFSRVPFIKDIILTTNWAESPENKITNLKLNLFGTLLVLIYLKYFFIIYPCVNSNCKGSTCKPSWCPHICWNK